MLKLIKASKAAKLGGTAATYRAGTKDIYGKCPNSCRFKPAAAKGTDEIDQVYLAKLLEACPDKGHAWTYSHFPVEDLPQDGPTVINFSADNDLEVEKSLDHGVPTVYTAPVNDLRQWPTRVNGVRFVECPAAANPDKVTCRTCGGGKPLCARADRDYVVVFPAHGKQKKLLGTEKGGCYAGAGLYTHNAWEKTRQGIGNTIDETANPDFLVNWAKSLKNKLLRHHVAGDIGK